MMLSLSVSFLLAVDGILVSSSPTGFLRQAPQHEPSHPSFRDEQPPDQLSYQIQQERTIDYWLDSARNTIDRIQQRKLNKNVAKNVILFLGDGMSISTVAMTRVYIGGEEKKLAFELFPDIGMSKTYSVNYQVPDSACTATAYLTGVKANYGTIGVNAKVPVYDCEAELDSSSHTHSIAKWAMDTGKDAGLVTTTRVTHASPAGVYAHTANRDRENDNEVKKDGCDKSIVQDIAHQLVHGETGKRLKVIMGGGRREFLHKDLDPETGKTGKRKDNRNLINEWLLMGEDAENRTYVWNKQDMLSVDPNVTDRLLGLFEPGHCEYNLNRIRDNLELEPTLVEMVDKATDILSKNENGFFLFVEGGRIDQAHHDTWARLALDETVEFSKAIELARQKFSEEDTLIVVTSDHSHSVSFAGFPSRSNDIFGAAGVANDQLPYMTISYANGLGFYDHIDPNIGGRVNISTLDTTGNEFRFPTTLPVDSETHGGEDVAVYASGPWSHLFTGSYEQNTIPHMMAYALCVGDGLTACSP
ncbi:membrane-bound alkaline phosphatase-like [Topomyia yanbarensis]|uniref:membrane-bound alkaline phosphatase-like n=1 Tax=Topomyia yanbarensis TaxID=2498891 RepID=UPI00273BC4D6|nr:membrane-bound alkaline phosphatase-like [Topomyia yanbarensis]